jgi:hypothetical protein
VQVLQVVLGEQVVLGLMVLPLLACGPAVPWPAYAVPATSRVTAATAAMTISHLCLRIVCLLM